MDYTGLKVLILEDDEQQTNIYSQIFDNLKIESLISNNLQDLERLVNTFKPQILLVDLRLDSDPLNSLAGLNVKKFFDPSKCIICSGLLETNVIGKCNDEGFFLILEKPITKDKIVKCLDMLWSMDQAKNGLFNLLDTKYRTLQEQDIILNSMNAGVYIKNKDLKYTTVNSSFLNMLGLTRDQVIGKTDQDFVQDSYKAEKFKVQDLHVIEHKQPIMDIIEFTNYNNKIKWTSTFKTPYLNDKGEVDEIVGLVVDITSFVEVKQLFDVTFDAILDGIIIIDSEFKITHCNEVVRNLNRDKLPIIGLKCFDLFGCNHNDFVECCLGRETFKTGRVNRNERIINNRWYDIRYYPIISGNIVNSIVITQRDIHDIKIREERLEYRISLERMLVRISSNFSGLRTEDIDSGINDALSEICQFFNLPIACVFQLNDDKDFLIKTHHYHLNSITPSFQIGDEIDIQCIGSAYLRILQGETIIGNIDDPEIPSTIRCLMYDSKVSLSLMIPITSPGSTSNVIGFICADNANQFSWDSDTIGLFQVIGEIFANAITRRKLEQALFKERERKENEIAASLDSWKSETKKAQDKTQSNIDMLSTILDEVAYKK